MTCLRARWGSAPLSSACRRAERLAVESQRRCLARPGPVATCAWPSATSPTRPSCWGRWVTRRAPRFAPRFCFSFDPTGAVCGGCQGWPVCFGDGKADGSGGHPRRSFCKGGFAFAADLALHGPAPQWGRGRPLFPYSSFPSPSPVLPQALHTIANLEPVKRALNDLIEDVCCEPHRSEHRCMFEDPRWDELDETLDLAAWLAWKCHATHARVSWSGLHCSAIRWL